MVTTVVLAVSFAKHGSTMSDAEIIARAKELGMVMQGDADDQKLKDEEEGNGLGDPDQNQPDDPDAGDQNGGVQQSPEADGDGQQPPAGTDQDQAAAPADGTPGQPADITQHEFTVERGDSSNMVSQRLAQMGLVDNAEAFNHYMTENSFDSRLLPGKVMIPEGATYEEIANLLVDKELQR